MKKYFTTKTITGLGILTAVLVVLFGISLMVKIGPLTFNLALIPIALGACMYGPIGGFILGFIDGVLNLLCTEVSAFMGVNAAATIIIVLLKTALAGLVAGLVFIPFKNKNTLIGCILASITVPVINTGIFVGGTFLFFMSLVDQYRAGTGMDAVKFVFIGFVGINFLVEVGVNAVLSPGIHTIYKVSLKRNQNN